MITDAGGTDELVRCATKYPCSVRRRFSRPRLRRPVCVARTRQLNDTSLADVHFWSFRNDEILIYSLIDEAARFHVTHVLRDQPVKPLPGRNLQQFCVDCACNQTRNVSFEVQTKSASSPNETQGSPNHIGRLERRTREVTTTQ